MAKEVDFIKQVGKCPICGGDVCKTGRGWKCGCGFTIPLVISNRRLADWEVEVLLCSKEILLDGFANKEMKMFSSVLHIDDNGEPRLESKVGICPKCGGNIHVGVRAYNCSNYSRNEAPCDFVIWRSISGHDVTVDEVQDILRNGFTSKPLDFYREDGVMYSKHIGLNPEKNGVVKL